MCYCLQLSVTIKKKAFGFVILVSLQYLMVVSASPIPYTDDPIIGLKLNVLKTSQCGKIGFWKHIRCERNEKVYQMFIDGCGLKCDPGFKPTCIQGDNGEAIHFCSPVDLICRAVGTCVSPCVTGYTRDVNGEFRCKKFQDVGYPQETEKKIGVNDNADNGTLQTHDPLDGQSEMTTSAQHIATQNWHKPVVIDNFDVPF